MNKRRIELILKSKRKTQKEGSKGSKRNKNKKQN